MALTLAILYALATGIMTFYGVNLLWLALSHARKDQSRPGRPPDPDAWPEMEGPWPAVTVQLPLYNEPFVAERLIDACAALDYPQTQLELQVLDDSTDETPTLVAKRVAYWKGKGIDIVHVQRDDRTGYKAGALHNGLRIARGDYIAIFDADFLPAPDFLRRMIPLFDQGPYGMVQARWAHLNEHDSLLTRVQAFGLDAHFALEQFVRNRAGYFMNFNGTAGIWDRRCIEEAGNWSADTLAEDLDLSYRAQLKGWQFLYVEDMAVEAELPATMSALRTQQFRWTKGAAQAAKKLLGKLWASKERFMVKLEGTVQLTAHFVFPFLFLAALLHAPLLMLNHVGMQGPGEMYFAVLGLGLFGFVGFFLAQLFAQRALYPNWIQRVRFFPLFMAGTMGLSVSNSRAIVEALIGKKTPFVRTPKVNTRSGSVRHRLKRFRSAISWVSWLEAGMAVYCLAGLVYIVRYGEWAAVPFQLLFALGFALVTYFTARDAVVSRDK